MGKTVVCAGEWYSGVILDMLSVRCPLEIQVQLSGRLLEVQMWLGERLGLAWRHMFGSCLHVMVLEAMRLEKSGRN